MGVNLKTSLRRGGLFMRCLTTALALAWVCLLVSDFAPPHVAPLRHGLHWLEAVCMSLLAVSAWAGPRRRPPPARDPAECGEVWAGERQEGRPKR